MSLTEYVRRKAKASGLKSHELATYAGVSPSWVRMFLSGQLEKPRVEQIEKLYEYLTGKTLVPEDAE